MFNVYNSSAQMGLDLIIVVSSYYSDTRHSAGFLCTSDRPVTDLKLTIHSRHKRPTSMPQMKLEPVIPESEGPQIYDLDRTASGIGYVGWKN